ncbi:MAG TPA: TIGR02266 family protein [Candidatus Baltobacteraceae bacterium]|nr:TIGR02266 family protein [Candidatus Baltobacteraceae bacterium]
MAAWRIVLAEDEALVAQMMLDMLAELPVEVSVARNGRDALTLVESSRPDLLLLDCMMPELDGFEVAAALKANPATQNIPIVFLTARGRVEDKVRGLDLGAEDYLVKPVRREEMLARVRNVLRRIETGRTTAPAESSLLRGRLEVVRLANLFQAIEAEQRTGTLRLAVGTRHGEIFFLQGRAAYALEGPRQGENAVYRMLGWTAGTFEVEASTGRGPDSAILTRPHADLVKEGARRMEEIPALRRALGPIEGPIKLVPLFRDGLLARTLPGGFHQLVELCDGTHLLDDILEASLLDEWGVLRYLDRFWRLRILESGAVAKRAHPRLGIQVPLEFQSLKQFQAARSLDISSRGMFVRTTTPFPVGEDILVRFQLPGVAQSFKAVGRVTWSSAVDTPQGVPAGMGVSFLDLAQSDQRTIEQYVVELLLDRVLKDDPDPTA